MRLRKRPDVIYREDPTDRASVRVLGMLTQNSRRLTESGREGGSRRCPEGRIGGGPGVGVFK